MQLFAGSRNAVRFVKLVVSTISACFAMCYRVPLPQKLVCVSLELPACGDLRRARQHAALHACICLVLTCTPQNMRARARAGLHAGEHACTRLVLTCTGHVQVCIAACRLRDSLVGLRFVEESLPSSVLNPPPVQNSLESPGLVYIIGHTAV